MAMNFCPEPALNRICSWTLGLLLGGMVACAWRGNVAASEPAIDFSRDILPILSDNCFQCHGPDASARQGDLRLDDKSQAFRTTDGLPIIAPGHSDQSELVRRILSSDSDRVMPPPESKRKLTSQQIQLLRSWIDQGAPWGTHWAYTKPRQVPLPEVKNVTWPRNEIDRFVLARLEVENVPPSRQAARETLIRRVTLDLTGLPPTLAEIDRFLSDTSELAYEKLVDRLLASPRYGERMAWDWLDAARYADTNGFQGDPERTMWPWRVWVVQVINADMPYDQFTIEQLAGDLLPEATKAQKLASGFHRNNMHNGEGGRIAEETRVENVFDRVETTTTVWLGATFTCCRCHDHKYDPFTLRDYYGLYDIFNQMSEDGAGRSGQAAPVIEMFTSEETARVTRAQKRITQLAKEIDLFELKKFPRAPDAPLRESAAKSLPGNLPAYIARTEPRKRNIDQLLEAVSYFEGAGQDADYAKLLKQALAAARELDSAQKAITKVMIMDQRDKPRETFILSKGAYDKPTDISVTGALPKSLMPERPTPEGTSTAQPASPPTRLTRIDLAKWLVSPENPLTARVTVNRFWQTFFGTGLVKTVEDFGVQGEKPSHPELLDWLAVDLMEHQWDIKALHRRIVTSATYRQDSTVTPELHERDPENRWLARGARFRLPAWMLRDIALAASGLLAGLQGGPSVKPYQPEGIWEEATFGKKKYEQDHGEAIYRRSLYVYWRRIVGPTMFFDSTARQTCSVKQFRTNTPLHALATLNDITYVEAARAMAEQLLRQQLTATESISQAFRRVLARTPSAAELSILSDRYQRLSEQFTQAPEAALQLLAVGESSRDPQIDASTHAALTGICQLILNLDEALSKE